MPLVGQRQVVWQNTIARRAKSYRRLAVMKREEDDRQHNEAKRRKRGTTTISDRPCIAGKQDFALTIGALRCAQTTNHRSS